MAASDHLESIPGTPEHSAWVTALKRRLEDLRYRREGISGDATLTWAEATALIDQDWLLRHDFVVSKDSPPPNVTIYSILNAIAQSGDDFPTKPKSPAEPPLPGVEAVTPPGSSTAGEEKTRRAEQVPSSASEPSGQVPPGSHATAQRSQSSSSRKLIPETALRKWMSGWLKTTSNPTHRAALEAAKEEFGGKVTRDPVRKLFQELQPGSQKPGPRGPRKR
jgi:hypothetical protein